MIWWFSFLIKTSLFLSLFFVSILSVAWSVQFYSILMRVVFMISPLVSGCVWVQDQSLTLPSCVCGRSVSRGSSRSCVWPSWGLARRLLASPRSGPVCRTERAPWSSSRSTRRRSRCYWLRREKKPFLRIFFMAPWQLVIVTTITHYMVGS